LAGDKESKWQGEKACAYAAGGNEASTALYPAAGFEAIDLDFQWEKVIEKRAP